MNMAVKQADHRQYMEKESIDLEKGRQKIIL